MNIKKHAGKVFLQFFQATENNCTKIALYITQILKLF